jgi:hypothetical protein
MSAQSLYRQIGFRDLIALPISSRIVSGPGQMLMGIERAGDAVAGLTNYQPMSTYPAALLVCEGPVRPVELSYAQSLGRSS